MPRANRLPEHPPKPLMMELTSYGRKYGLSAEDNEAWAVFDAHKHEFKLDDCKHADPFNEAKRFTEKYFKGTKYVVGVESYCCYCTVTTLYKIIE